MVTISTIITVYPLHSSQMYYFAFRRSVFSHFRYVLRGVQSKDDHYLHSATLL